MPSVIRSRQLTVVRADSCLNMLAGTYSCTLPHFTNTKHSSIPVHDDAVNDALHVSRQLTLQECQFNTLCQGESIPPIQMSWRRGVFRKEQIGRTKG